jgi:hypothetical protein
MEPEKIAPICYMMKDAAMIAGDKLMEGGSRREAGELLLDELISGWMDGGYGDVAVCSDILAVPSMARRTEEGYALEDFVTGAAGYDGPYFAVSAGGADALQRGLFDAGISVAFLTGRQPLAAVVYDPVHVELFHAIEGLGAYLNGKRIAPSKACSLADAMVSLDHATLRINEASALLNEAGQIRVAPVAALELCYAACGRVDAALRRGTAFFDCAAALLVAAEAGAAVTDGRGGTFAIKEYGQRCDMAVSAPGLAGDVVRCLG